jgi:hydrogenase nickel incorporation protein HypA/HybF
LEIRIAILMHELSIAQSILDIIDEYAARDGFLTVLRLELEVGALSGIEVDALQFALEAIRPSTNLAEALITVDMLEADGRCSACGMEFRLRETFAPCPRCGSGRIETRGGTDVRIRNLHVR